MARLSLSLLGPLQVMLDGQPVTGFKSNKVRALLAYLAVEADRPHRREVLAGLLWPEWPDREAMSNLRYALSNLRRVIGDAQAAPPFLLITRHSLQFNTASDCWLDVAAFTGMVEVEVGQPSALDELEEVVDLYRGSFLEGFSVGDSAAYEEWALYKREQMARQMSTALHRLARGYEERGEYERAQSFAWRQVEVEPWDEVAHQALMRTLALGGQRSAALAQYGTCRRLLAEELGVEPAAETTGLYEQIRDGTLKAPVPSAARASAVVAEPPAFLDEELVEVESPVFVAREHELAQLDGFLDRALAGRGRVVFVTGDAGSGKTALIREFARRAQTVYPNLVAAGGQGNAHTGAGDPYLPFREILCLLCGDVEAQWAAGAMTREQARRLWHLLPQAVESLVKGGPDLIDLFVPGASLLERARTIRPQPFEPVWLTQLETLVARKAAAPGIPAVQQSALFEQYSQVLRAMAAQRPLLLALDDLQWADSGSFHLLFHLGRRLAGNRILLVGAYRPAEIALGRPASPPAAGAAERALGQAMEAGPLVRERHPLMPIVNEFKRTFGDIEVDLEWTEGRPFVDALLDCEPNSLGDAFREALYLRTQGHPLFTVELLRGMQERGDLIQDDKGQWVGGPALDWETLPARVEAVVAERIGRLPQSTRDLLSVASVEGETFTAEVVARVQGAGEPETVRCLSKTLDKRHRLVSAHGIRRLDGQRMSQYRFRHIVFQKYLYSSLDQVECAYLHEQVGTVLEEMYKDQESAAIAAIAPQLARHFEGAGLAEKTIHYLHQAGERALQLSAYQEGIAHLTRGLALLKSLPDSADADRRLQRAEQELALQLALGMALQGTKGTQALEMKEAYARARELCRQTGKTSLLCQVLGEVAVHHYVRAEHRTARELGEEALSLAQETQNPLLVALGHWYLGLSLFGLGEHMTALAHFEQVGASYIPEQHHLSFVLLRGSDAGLSALAYTACSLWCLGYPDQALKQSQEVLALAKELNHPFSLADVLCYAGCMFSEMRRDAQALRDNAEELIRLSSETVSVWLPMGVRYRGGALTMLGRVQEGIALMCEVMTSSRLIGARCYLPGTLCSIAEAQAMAGQPEEGLTTLDEAFALVEKTDERHGESELYRVRAELLLMQGNEAEAEASLHKAIDVARRQSARSWELRATTSLARLWHRQGKHDQAGRVLAEIYCWFSEGFDTADLKEARALLDELSPNPGQTQHGTSGA